MQPAIELGFDQIALELVRGLMDAVLAKPFPSEERKASAQQAVICTVMAYQPRDPVELTMAGHCVVYDRLLLDGAHDLLYGQAEDVKIKARPGILAAGKMFLSAVAMLEHRQRLPDAALAMARKSRPAAAPAQEQTVPPPTETEASARAHQAGPRPESTPETPPAAPEGLTAEPVAASAGHPARPDTHPAASDTHPAPAPGHSHPTAEPPVPSAGHAPQANSRPVAALANQPVATDQPPATPTPLEFRPGVDDPVATLAALLAPGKVEEMLFAGFTPEEKRQFQEQLALVPEPAD